MQWAVVGAVEEDAFGGPAVAARAPGLLVILLQAAGEVVVDHLADVGEVDAHAEGRGGDDDLETAGGELLVDVLALSAIDGALPRPRADPRAAQHRPHPHR